jgi:hypothetical protein
MLLRSFLVSLFLLPSSLAAADSEAYRCTGPTTGPVRVIAGSEDGNGCLGFVDGGKEHRFSRMISGTLLVASDGKTIVMIEDYLSANRAGGAIVALVGGEQIVNPVVLQIWHDGKRRGMYDVARLVKDVSKVEESISHVRWVAKLPSSIGATFTFVTTSGRELTFDSKTGNLVGERDVPVPKRS